MLFETIIGFISLVIVLFIPGYFLSLAFFTRRNEIDAIERVTLSFVFSITFLSLLILIGNQVLQIPFDIYLTGGTFVLLIIAGLLGYFVRIGVVPSPIEKIPREEAVPLIPKLGQEPVPAAPKQG